MSVISKIRSPVVSIFVFNSMEERTRRCAHICQRISIIRFCEEKDQIIGGLRLFNINLCTRWVLEHFTHSITVIGCTIMFHGVIEIEHTHRLCTVTIALQHGHRDAIG